MPLFQYTEHLTERMSLREIPQELPEVIYLQAEARYVDVLTDNYVAIKHHWFQGEVRPMALAYTVAGEVVTLITIHPLSEAQVLNRVRAGRWMPHET